ncbi:hypothetical protein [Bacillus sp. HNG]|nr:hypothetical protein [Bacillus sp. HNG]
MVFLFIIVMKGIPSEHLRFYPLHQRYEEESMREFPQLSSSSR